MEVGGIMQSNEERGVEKVMDDYLKSIGLHRKKIAKDGSCLFRAVAEQVLHCQSLHAEVRAKCVEFLKQNRDSYEAFIEGDFEDYLCKLQDPQQWVGEVEINALAVMYKRDFLIFQEPGKPAVNITDNNFKDKVRLCFLNGNHYDSVYPIDHIKSAAVCQSILYELLYDGVFKVDRSSLGACQRTGRASDLLSDDNMPACASSDESDLDTGEALWVENGTSSTSTRHNNQSYRGRGRGRQLPERVRRSLNPTLLRNIEYDVWQKTKRAQQKMDYCIAAGMHFTVGDRCQVRLEGGGRSYSATIKEVPPNNGPVTVYIDELGRRQSVPLWSLRPPSDAGSWSTVTNRDKKLSNGHGDWEEGGKGRGRGRGKAVPASSSVSAATAQGAAGRVQKQHSWPPQATVEEQGAAKPTRKSVSAAESAFGLTDEERLAKEEEKRNVALVEIQLRDEHSFPALGTQNEGGKRKGGEKKRSQRNKTKSPVEDVRAPSPKSLTPPPPISSSASETNIANPAPPVDSAPTWLSSIKASTPNMAASASYASTAGPAGKPAVTPPPSAGVYTFVTPVLPPASSSPPPTFIAPIAPSPSSAQGLPRSSPPTSCLPHSPSPPSSLHHPAAPVQDAPAAPSQSTNSLPKTEATVTSSETVQRQSPQSQSSAQEAQDHIAEKQTSVPQSQNPASVSQNQVLTTQSSVPQNQTQNESSVLQNQNQSSVLQNQNQSSVLQDQSSVLQTQSSVPESSLPPLHVQPPHPSQVPHPSLCLTSSPPQSLTETPPPPPPQQPPHPPPLLGSLPLQQLSQVYQDPLYPGFPQGEKGDVALTPGFSSSRTGDDLPRDVNILRFFFNLGIKAYSMHWLPPYMYLLPLQQAHAMQPKLSSRSPSPHYLPSNPPTRHQEAYLPPQYPPTSTAPQYPPTSTAPQYPPTSTAPQYPPTSTAPQYPPTSTAPQYPPTSTTPQYPPTAAPSQYDHQTHLAEPPPPAEPPFSQAGYPVPQPHRMPCPSLPWQQMPPSRTGIGYSSTTPSYPIPPTTSQGYPPGHSPGHQLYPPAVPPYPPSSLGYQAASAPEELQVSQGALEQLEPANGDTMPGHGRIRVPGPLESPAAANVANANSRSVLPAGFTLQKEPGDSLTRAVLLVDPPLNNKPILALVSDPDVKDAPVALTTMKPSSSPASHSPYRGPRQSYGPLRVLEAGQVGYLAPEPLSSVGCSTEDDWGEAEEVRPVNIRGTRRSYRGGRSRGGYRRRQGGEMGAGPNYGQFNPSQRGRGRERSY